MTDQVTGVDSAAPSVPPTSSPAAASPAPGGGADTGVGTVSVIVPVYNAANALERCLDSVLAQEYRDLQVILVDDGSTDASAQICDDAAAADARVQAFHRANGGPPAARNTGLDAVRGAWTFFVDADDAIEPDYIAQLVECAVREGADIVLSDCLMVEPSGTRRFGMVVPDKLYTTRDALWQDFLSDRLPWSLWGKLYRSNLFDGLRFDPQDYIAEDLDMNARIFAREGLRVATTPSTGYAYTVAEGSVDHSFTARHLRQLEVFERVVQLARSLDLQADASPEAFYEERVLSCLRKAIKAGALNAQVTSAFKRALALHRAEVLTDPHASKGLKLRMRASRLGPKAYAILNRLYG